MKAPLSELLSFWDRSPLAAELAAGGDAGVPEVARAFAVAGLSRTPGPLLVVLGRSREAEAFTAELGQWLPAGQVGLFPAWEVLPGEAVSPTAATMGRRLRVVRDLAAADGPQVVVTSVRAFVQKTAAPAGAPIQLAEGREISLDEIAGRLAAFGFERNYLVEREGEFSIRGGILDVYPPDAVSPVRADFFGDEITSLRRFSIGSQRSAGAVESLEILPAHELLLDAGVRAAAGRLLEGAADERLSGDLERIAAGVAFPGMERYLGLLNPDLRPLASFLPDGGRVVIIDPKGCSDRSREFLAQAGEWAPAESEAMFCPFEEASGEAPAIGLWQFARTLNLEVRGWDASLGRPDDLASSLRDLRAAGATVAVAAGRWAARARDVLADAGLALPIQDARAGEAVVCEGEVEHGFVLASPDLAAPLVLVGVGDLFGRRRPAEPAGSAPEGARASALLLQLAPGDYVVHETYGVGRYLGMVTRQTGGASRDYLSLEYHGGDRLYVPTENLDAVTRYTGGDAPKLNRLGTGEWERSKKRARAAVKEIAHELVALAAKRYRSEGHPFSPDTPWQRELEDGFRHVETHDQARAIDEVKEDMERPRPMDRVVCGDVGYGKTEVAVRAAFKAVQDSKQVAVLVPTTILAQQHFQTFTERFSPFPAKVAQLSRFLSAGEQAGVLEDLAAGKVDVIIGTHRLLQRDVRFSDLGLVVVDEEQRFGVQHKEALKRLKESVDVLTLSATPIPRTLEMSMTGIRDISLVDTPPVDRRPVTTYVGSYDEQMVAAAIRRELAREGQVFFVHNRVQSIKAAARRVAGLVPGIRLEVAHGQMSESELERVMLDVWDQKVDVLVCTTIIESGLDIPAMNTLIVERADRLGLAQLYQLRGRVGRARERAYAYFFYRHEEALTQEAHERLKTLSEFTELGSGFKIALRDLEIRGAGNLIGAQQSGHIAAVGFDLYLRMMSETVAGLKGSEPEEKLEVRIDLPMDAFIPSEYIARESLRIETYRQIERVRSSADALKLAEELSDRYGDPGEPVRNLLAAAELRAFMAAHGIEELSVRDGVLKARPFPELAESKRVRLHRIHPQSAFKEVTRTLLVPGAPASGLAPWVLDTVRGLAG